MDEYWGATCAFLAEEVVVRADLNKKKYEDIFILLVYQEQIAFYMALAIVFKLTGQLVVAILCFKLLSSLKTANYLLESLLIEILVSRESFEGSFISSRENDLVHTIYLPRISR